MSYLILNDRDVRRVLDMPTAIRQIRAALAEKHHGTLVAPPRFGINAGKGGLVFTAGAAYGQEKVIGFRVYDTYPGPASESDQIVAVYNSETGQLRGLITGKMVGVMRTGAIGGVAVDVLARPDARTVGVIGTGMQAQAQLEGVAAVRDLEAVRVYSRRLDRRTRFAYALSRKLDVPIEPVDSVEQAVREVDVLISATTSHDPVFEVAWLSPGTHINAVGPKVLNRHEIDPEVARYCRVIATDSLVQVDSYGVPFFLDDTPYRQKMVELSDVMARAVAGRSHEDDITLFASVGLAGTEVVVANAVIDAILEG